MSRRARFVEFLLTGGATLFLFPLSWIVRHVLHVSDAELGVGMLTFYGAFLINDPHFAVTYILFYKKREFPDAMQRARFLFSGFVVPVVLIAWAVFALRSHSANSLGWMIQLMFATVGWHYVKQGFGVLTVLSARRGIRPSTRERRVVLVHCFAGWAFAWANPSVPSGEFEEKGVVYTALAHPRWFELASGSALLLSSIALIWVFATGKKYEGRFLPIAPVAGLLVTIWSWTIFSSYDPLVRYAIPALHSIQYLYFVYLLRRNEARASEGPPSFGRPAAVRVAFLAVGALALGWLFFHGAPDFLDSAFVPKLKRGAIPDDLGETPYFATLFVMVSIHHYFMDFVIWRRENPDTRWLTHHP